MVIIMRLSINFFMTSLALTSSFVGQVRTVMPSARVIVRVTGGGGAESLRRLRPRIAARPRPDRGADGRGGGGR